MSMRKFKKRLRKVMGSLFSFVNLFYEPYLFCKLRKQIRELPKGTQLFFMNRNDFGTLLQLLNYVRDWEEQLGPTALVILTYLEKPAKELVSTISPKTTVIAPNPLWHKIFGNYPVHFKCYLKVLSQLLWEFPSARFLYHENINRNENFVRTNYSLHTDLDLKYYEREVSSQFLKAYKEFRWKISEAHEVHFPHYRKLYYQSATEQREICKGDFNDLGISRDYVILNIPFTHAYRLHFKRLGYPERYNVLIDYLIKQGYDVVIHGRQEQPHFTKRPGLIDYAHSKNQSPLRDLQLFSSAIFAIISSTGSEIFSQLTFLPTLSLNETELFALTLNPKTRFYPKKIYDNKKGDFLDWQAILSNPIFFSIDGRDKGDRYEYIELDEEELMEGLLEFQALIGSGKWSLLTDNQRAFKKQVTPLHLDLYHSQTLPCDCYLAPEMSKTNSPLVVFNESSTS